jgi:hypothetical protein
MDKEYIKKSVVTIVAGYILFSNIVDYGDEPHLHPEFYNGGPSDTSTYSVVVSGTTYGVELPDYIQDLGTNPDNEQENLFRVEFSPTPLDDWDH